ncbi:3-hydroxyisobutyrate dehydrogenase, putative [Perkinsus marinus ATCC 50983]|uniref:3-hydroxyisobutyrate dehydrogenase n=1 Tax=Perkinsus marinus (strain ATCC 50983 / TXsc) TaxID=423536 RepID=C5LVB1_PERM5|nr:3-hydroxyisobutyrate dehydrogenase, putative [Perkinsus marinus ATCC 50983]EEQ99349.1 3-hydroxyisobutyrate dehydrogenase, putative [Perkinsus marinus ATCC 50983]|eukprot:XP_002766632.1 3-hydroxyisobutyrate dehydrogenase, putative [Perkinsus marinus ATCC 50983]
MLSFARRGVGSYRGSRCFSTIGFIGLGNMGAGMAANLLKAQRNLVVFDKFKDSPGVKEAASKGARVAEDLEELCGSSEVIISMLPGTRDVEELYTATNGGILSLLEKSSFLIDCSTIDPIAAQHVIRKAQEQGHRMVDAPVSGGVPAAKAGTLTFMVGADTPEDLKTATAILDAMGNPKHCGGTGLGQAVKVSNNLILAASMLGVAEGFRLAKSLGVDPKVFAEIVNTSTGRCWSSDTYNPVPGVLDKDIPSNRSYSGGFMVDLMVKDLDLAKAAAEGCGAEVPVAAFARDLYASVGAKGHGRKDFSCVYEYSGKE